MEIASEFPWPMVIWLCVQVSWSVLCYIARRFKEEETKTKLPTSRGIDRRKK